MCRGINSKGFTIKRYILRRSFPCRGHYLSLRRYQVGRALRAVDSRLKMEWIHWAENGLYCKGSQNKRRRQPYDFSSTTEIPDSTLVGLARTTNMGQGCGAASRYLPSAETQGLLQRRKRRLRAWCSKVGVEARRWATWNITLRNQSCFFPFLTHFFEVLCSLTL